MSRVAQSSGHLLISCQVFFVIPFDLQAFLYRKETCAVLAPFQCRGRIGGPWGRGIRSMNGCDPYGIVDNYRFLGNPRIWVYSHPRSKPLRISRWSLHPASLGIERGVLFPWKSLFTQGPITANGLTGAKIFAFSAGHKPPCIPGQ